MAKLIINIPGAPASEVELKPGMNRLGRSLNTDIQIAHPSVSSAHCEMVEANGALMIKDLGSTNGTYIDGKAIQESSLQAGQKVRIGEVELALADQAAPRPVARIAGAKPPRPPDLPVSTTPPVAPGLPPVRAAPKIGRVGKPGSFYASLPAAFVFPFRRDGLILLAGGTIFFVVMNFLSGYAGIIAIGMGIFTFGYFFAYMQSIINTTAQGDEEMPMWPDFDGWTSVAEPFWQLLAIVVVCLGPAWLYTRFASNVQLWLEATLWIGGLLYLPMSLLAVTIYDSLAALNPLLIVLSIVKVPLEYAATCVVFGLLYYTLALASRQLDEAIQSPLLSTIVREFFSLYTLTVVMRVVGLLFYTKQERLGWALGTK